MRRRSDKWAHRAVLLFSALACATGLLAAVIGYRALVAINTFNDFIGMVKQVSERRRPPTLEEF